MSGIAIATGSNGTAQGNREKLTLILNGKSAGRQDVRDAVSRFRQEGGELDVRVTWEAGDAARFARQSAHDSVVVAGGGDGTVNEVVQGVIGSDGGARIAIMPLGTANDFASSVGIPVDPFEALLLAASGTAHRVNVGVVNDRKFVNLASGGFGAEVTAETPVQLKNLIGGGAYALMAALLAMKAHPYRGRLETPDHTYEGSMVMMAVGNGRQAGGGAQMTPRALIDDGFLDVMVVPDHEHSRFAHLLSDLMQLRHGESEHFHYLRLKQFVLESEDPLQFNLDGEPIHGRRFEFDLLPGALRVVLPDNCSMLGNPGTGSPDD